MADKFTLEQNKDYWEDENTISIIDKNLHQLEIQFISSYLKPDMIMADIGCGNGDATLQYAQKVAECTGIERSDRLRSLAQSKQQHQGIKNLKFVDGDILALGHDAAFDAVVTQRVLINLPSWDKQRQAIDNIYTALKPGGTYALIENTWDGQEAMNEWRTANALKPIGLHWHNEYIDFEQFKQHIEGRFKLVERRSFSLYYLLTRVYVQMFASFEGFGKEAKADPIFDVSDKAARQMQEKFGDLLDIKDTPALGPIQGFALQKIG